jgi:hypothetical protein
VVPATDVSIGIPVTLAPPNEDGDTFVQAPAGPEELAKTTGPVRVDPTAAQVAAVEEGGDWQATSP